MVKKRNQAEFAANLKWRLDLTTRHAASLELAVQQITASRNTWRLFGAVALTGHLVWILSSIL